MAGGTQGSGKNQTEEERKKNGGGGKREKKGFHKRLRHERIFIYHAVKSWKTGTNEPNRLNKHAREKRCEEKGLKNKTP